MSHPQVRAVAGEMQGSADARTRMVARVLLYLYRRRTAADYNHLVRFTHPRTKDLVNLADEAVAEVADPDFPDAFPRALAARA